MNTILNENEVPTRQSNTPHINSTEQSSATANYNTEDNISQGSPDKNTQPRRINFYKFNEFQHSYFAKYANIRRIHNVNHIHRGKLSGIYVYDDDLIRCTIQKLVPQFRFTDINEEFQQLNIATKLEEVAESPYNYVGFRNGVYDIFNQEFKEFILCTPNDYILTNKLGIDYADPNIVKSSANVSLINQFFNEVSNGNAELEQLLYEIIGTCCIRGSIMPMAFVFSGSSEHINNDGRKMLINILNAILGNCVAHESLQNLATGNSTMELYTKTCNISNEQEPPKVNNMNTLRNLICGNKFTDKKSNLVFNPYATMIFNVTDILNFDNSLLGLNGYFKVIPFNKTLTFDKSKIDMLLSIANLQYITFKSLEAYSKISNSDTFTIPDIVEQATNQYLLDSNSAREFISINPIFEVIEKRPYYDRYWNWCEANNKLVVSDAQFGKEVLKCGYKAIRISADGDRYNYYTVPNFNGNSLRNKYLEYMLDKTNYTEVADDKFAVNKFIKAFADYFINHSIDDEAYNIEALTTQIDNGKVTIDDIVNITDNI